jgi:hypothetical protein
MTKTIRTYPWLKAPQSLELPPTKSSDASAAVPTPATATSNCTNPDREPKYELRSMPLDSIRVDQRVQARAPITEPVVKEYAEAMQDGAEFSPLIVFCDGQDHVLADGFHRHPAALRAGLSECRCEVRPGELREAILFAAGANATHGRKRTKKDKRRAVAQLLGDAEWSSWSNHEIARHCGVGHQLVGKIREALTGPKTSEQRLYRTKYGKVAKMNTAKIGRRSDLEALQQSVLEATKHDTILNTDDLSIAQCDQLNSASTIKVEVPNDFDEFRLVLREIVNFISARANSNRVECRTIITILGDDVSTFDSLIVRANSIIAQVLLRPGASEILRDG